jgi:hypothetical protein
LNRNNSSNVQTWSVRLAAIAGVLCFQGIVAIIIAGGITYKKKREKKITEEAILKTDEEKILEILKDPEEFYINRI